MPKTTGGAEQRDQKRSRKVSHFFLLYIQYYTTDCMEGTTTNSRLPPLTLCRAAASSFFFPHPDLAANNQRLNERQAGRQRMRSVVVVSFLYRISINQANRRRGGRWARRRRSRHGLRAKCPCERPVEAGPRL